MIKQYILFDLDGTLTDPSLGITNSVMYALRALGEPIEERAFYYRFIGPPLLHSFAYYCGFSAERAREALRLYREYFSEKGIFENKVYDGMPTLLADLSHAGYRLAVATSKPEVFAKQILEHFNMARWFSFIGGADLEETRATKDAVIAYTLANLGCPLPDACIMVGDRKYDIEGAGKNGMEAIGVLYGYGSRAELAEAGAIEIVSDMDDLRRIFLK